MDVVWPRGLGPHRVLGQAEHSVQVVFETLEGTRAEAPVTGWGCGGRQDRPELSDSQGSDRQTDGDLGSREHSLPPPPFLATDPSPGLPSQSPQTQGGAQRAAVLPGSSPALLLPRGLTQPCLPSTKHGQRSTSVTHRPSDLHPRQEKATRVCVLPGREELGPIGIIGSLFRSAGHCPLLSLGML